METKIQKDLVTAMKEKNSSKVTVLREIKTAISNFKTSPNYKGECTNGDVLNIIQKISKQHKDSAQMYADAGRKDLVEEELSQLNYINEYLPKMLTEEETIEAINSIIQKINATSVKDMGKVMSLMKETYPNQYDPKFVGNYVKNKLK
jgi:uncharacterized protein YqeY